MIQHVSRAFALLSLSLSLLSSYNQPFGILLLPQYLQENRDYVSVNRDTTFVVIIIQIHQARRPTPSLNACQAEIIGSAVIVLLKRRSIRYSLCSIKTGVWKIWLVVHRLPQGSKSPRVILRWCPLYPLRQ
jgi:hypothetical protein